MRASTEKLAFLKNSLAQAGLEGRESHARAALGHPGADACLKGGIARGTLHEIFPAVPGDEAPATGFAAALSARVASRKRVLWLLPDFAALEHGEISALGLLEFGLDPARFILLRTPDAISTLRAAADALATAALGALIIEIPGSVKALDLSASRRLVLAAAETGVTAFLLRCSAEPAPSAAETRWLIRAAGSKSNDENWGRPLFEATLVRNRHGPTGQWLMEWNSDDQLFRAADPGVVVSASCDRPSQAMHARSAQLSRVA